MTHFGAIAYAQVPTNLASRIQAVGIHVGYTISRGVVPCISWLGSDRITEMMVLPNVERQSVGDEVLEKHVCYRYTGTAQPVAPS